MASRRPGVTSRGTARELAELDNGFAANGESMFTRRAAKPDANATMAGNVPKTRGRHSHAALIAENMSALAKLRGDLLLASSDPARQVLIRHNITIKENFLQRLRSEMLS